MWFVYNAACGKDILQHSVGQDHKRTLKLIHSDNGISFDQYLLFLVILHRVLKSDTLIFRHNFFLKGIYKEYYKKLKVLYT